jgi:hypothetical protein
MDDKGNPVDWWFMYKVASNSTTSGVTLMSIAKHRTWDLDFYNDLVKLDGRRMTRRTARP